METPWETSTISYSVLDDQQNKKTLISLLFVYNGTKTHT